MIDLGTVQGFWWAAVVSMSVQFTLLVAFGLALNWLLRKRDPRLRYAMWVLILMRLLVPTDLSNPLGHDPGSTFSSWAGILPQADAAASLGVGRNSRPLATAGLEASAASPDRALSSAAAVPAAQRTSKLPRLPNALFFLWTAGVGIFGLVLVRRIRRTRQLVASAAHSRELTDVACELSFKIGVASVPARLASRGLLSGGPVVTGLVRPVILLPTDASRTWRADELRAAMAHELAHVYRRDLWVHAVQQVLQMLFFFHPLAWLVNQKINRERELCCDDAVMRAMNGGKRHYLQALMRCVDSQSSELSTVLGVAQDGQSVTRRIRRMTNPSYSKGTTHKLFGTILVAVVVLVSTAFIATESAGNDEADSSDRVHGTSSLPQYFLVSETGEVDWDNPRPWNGDVEAGWKKEGTALGSLTIPDNIEGTIQIRLLVEPDGTVHSSHVLKGIEPTIDTAFLDLARTHKFKPSVHKVAGPVGAEIVYSIRIDPAVVPPAEPRPGLGAVVHVVRAVNEAGEPMAAKGEQTLPQYLNILESTDFDQTVDDRLFGDFSFGLAVTQSGTVEKVQHQGAPKRITRSRDLYEAAQGLIGQLTEWIETFRLAPLEKRAVGPYTLLVSLDVRVRKDGVEVDTFTPPGDGWKDELGSLYSLEAGQAVKLIPAPFLPARLDLFRALDPSGGRRHPGGSSSMVLAWTDDGLVQMVLGNCYGGCSLLAVPAAGVHKVKQGTGGYFLTRLSRKSGLPIEVELGNDTESAFLGNGDLLLREGADTEELLNGFASEVYRLLDRPVSWERTVSMQPTIILRGSVGDLVTEPALDNQRMLHIYTDDKDPDPRSGAGFFPATDGASLALALETFLGIEVIDETVSAFDPFTVRLHRSASGTELLDRVLANIEEQTDLETSLESRPADVIRVRIGH